MPQNDAYLFNYGHLIGEAKINGYRPPRQCTIRIESAKGHSMHLKS